MKKDKVKNQNGSLEDKLKDALIKRAVGGNNEEVIEEYSYEGEEGAPRLTKRKVSIKYSPPDVAAVKALLALEGMELDNISDAELIEERDKLIRELNGEGSADL